MSTSVAHKTEIRRATEDDILYVTMNMRDVDWREISPLLWVSEKEDFAKSTWKECGDFAWVIINDDGERVAVFGGNLILPYVTSIWLWATDKIKNRDWVAITKHGKTVLNSIFEQGVVHRAQAMVAKFNTEARVWIAKCGLTHEAEVLATGKNKEDYIIMSRFVEKKGD